jgi:hypothetical protein
MARSLIQWNFEFAPIPDGLPGILMVSVSTTAVAAGVNAARGPKGAGWLKPRLADLITAGGVVSAERFQFFVWTLLGVASFLFLVVSNDPAKLHDLPKIPDGFLYLMGISSFGYLGGKLARKPGPVIEFVTAEYNALVIEIRGRNLSTKATFRIDGQEVTYTLKGQNQPAGAPPADAVLEVIPQAGETADGEFVSLLRVTLSKPAEWLAAKLPGQIATADEWWLTDKHILVVTNPDGQMAEAKLHPKKKAAA